MQFRTWIESCFQWFKDTNLKANHNKVLNLRFPVSVVSNGSKILIWKQITTSYINWWWQDCCFQWFKDTNLKANHNAERRWTGCWRVVSNGSKILIWKQITTASLYSSLLRCCFQWFKDTNLKANHNVELNMNVRGSVVSNGSKILIWKQITTRYRQYHLWGTLFPMVQRY